MKNDNACKSNATVVFIGIKIINQSVITHKYNKIKISKISC